MLLSERIQQVVDRLPAFFQAEVLHFVEYLAARAELEQSQQERRNWSSLSLTAAMRRMEDEDTSAYTLADLKVLYS